MKCREMFVMLLYCAGLINVSIAQVPEKNIGPANTANDYFRNWGFVNVSNTIEDRNQNHQNSTEAPATYNPCDYYNVTKPNFSAPGLKISDEKCLEYKWDRKLEEELEKRAKECHKLSLINGGKQPAHAVGGRPTFLGEFPHMGAIGWKAAIGGGYIFKCGGTLISNKFVLTAAHCSSASSVDTALADPVPKIVRLNDKNLFPSEDQSFGLLSHDANISRIIVHPEYKAPKKYFDIALIELQHEVFFTWRLNPACLWTKKDLTELGNEATLTGWGVLTQGSFDISPELQAAVVNNLDSDKCDILLRTSHNRNWWGIRDHQLCAGKLAGGVDACQGDSGGPLQVKEHIAGTLNQSVYYVIGVTSFGIGCALPNLPGIYTRVSSFIDWVEGYVWP